MRPSEFRPTFGQRGMVLVSSLLLLIVVTLIALSMFRSFGIQEKIAGNVREKQRALQAAVSAQTYAENWLVSNSSVGAAACNSMLNATTGNIQICSNPLPLNVTGDVTTVPWQISGALVGENYVPPGMVVATASVNAAAVDSATFYGTFVANPVFYISDMGPSTDNSIQGEIYQIDAVGYGGNSSTVAVVESTYAVYTTSSNGIGQ
jgi:type IV pilus assembly protein PilX